MASYVNVPGLAGLKDAGRAFKENVNPLDVLLGVGVGMVAGAVFKVVFDTKIAKHVNATTQVAGGFVDASQGVGKLISQYSENIGSAGAGLVLFGVQKGSKRGAGHLVGAVAAAVVPAIAAKVSQTVLANVPGLNGYVLNPYGMIANDGAYGMIANDGAYGMIANDGAYGTSYVQLPGAMSELRSISQQIGEEADEFMV